MHRPVQSSSVTTSAVYSDATGSAVCSTSTTDKLHERVSAPYGLGHSSIAITMNLYSHVLPGLSRQAASQVAGAILGADVINR